jgi:hypothetical protein
MAQRHHGYVLDCLTFLRLSLQNDNVIIAIYRDYYFKKCLNTSE